MYEKFRQYIKYLPIFILAVFLYSLITNFESAAKLFTSVFGFLSYILSRFVIGFVLAYMLNFISTGLEKRLKFRRWLSITVTYLLFFGFIVWLVLYIIPLMYDSIQQIFKVMPQYYETVRSFVNRFFFSFSESERQIINDYISQASQSFVTYVSGVLDVSAIEALVRSSARLVLNIFFGIMISVYALIEKKNLLRMSKRVLHAVFRQDNAVKILTFMRDTHRIFSNFIVGKLLTALLVGVASFILYAIFGLPLAPFLAVIAGVFNIIPYFGPWIGGAITVIALLCYNPIFALYALIITLAVQTLDNIFIGPKVLGGMVGMSPLLTIIAITIGGDIGGLPGIFFGIPALAAIKTLIIDELVKKRLESRNITIE